MLPEWFKLTPGFRFFDHDGHLCVLLGWEPEGQVLDKTVSVTVNGETTVGRSVELTPRMTYAYWRKNTWHLEDFNALVLFNEDYFQPCPDNHPILKMLITKRTTKHMSINAYPREEEEPVEETHLVEFWCRDCEKHFTADIPARVENALAGPPAVNPNFGYANDIGWVTCPMGHTHDPAACAFGGVGGLGQVATGTWSLTESKS